MEAKNSVGKGVPINEHIVTVAVISIIGFIGYTKGLDMLQNLEKIALGVTLIIIVALLAGFAFYDVNALKGPGIQMPKIPDHSWWQILTLVGGTLIVVQGFETSRAFAFYYTLQCLVAFNVSQDRNQRIGIALVAAALGFITLFAVPAG